MQATNDVVKVSLNKSKKIWHEVMDNLRFDSDSKILWLDNIFILRQIRILDANLSKIVRFSSNYNCQ